MDDSAQTHENIEDYVNYSPSKEAPGIPLVSLIRFGIMWMILMTGVVFKLADFNSYFMIILTAAIWGATYPENNVKVTSLDFIIIFGMSVILGLSLIVNFHQFVGMIFILSPIFNKSRYFGNKKVKYQSKYF